MKREEIKSLWRHPNFIKLWAGQTVSLFGSQISLLAIPLTAVLILNATPLQMGILTAAEAVPYLLFGLVAGVWVDRLRRRAILIVADVGRFIVLSLIPLDYLLGILRIELLYLLAFLVGTLSIFFDVAYRSYLPSLIEREQLIEGNSKLELSRSVGEIVGPGLAGVLVQVFAAPIAIMVDSLSFLASALSLLWIRTPEEIPKVEVQRKIGITLLFAPLVIGASDLLIPIAGLVPLFAFPLLGVAQLLFGLARPVFNINQLSLRQTITPERLLGRMNASVSFVVFGIPTIGALLGGALGQSIGLQKTLVVAAIGEILACLWIFFSPIRKVREQN